MNRKVKMRLKNWLTGCHVFPADLLGLWGRHSTDRVGLALPLQLKIVGLEGTGPEALLPVLVPNGVKGQLRLEGDEG